MDSLEFSACIITLQYPVSDAVVILARIKLKESYTVVKAIGGIVSSFGVILIARPNSLFPNSGVVEASSVTILLRFGADPRISVSSLEVTIISCIAILVVFS